MSTPAPPLPGETPEQRRARLSAAYAVQARIDAQRQAELEAQEQARRKEMQAQIDNMLRSAYVLPPLPSLPLPSLPAPPKSAPMYGDGPLRPTQAQIDAFYASGRGGAWDPVRGAFLTSEEYQRAQPLPPMPDLPPLPPPPPMPTYYDTFPSPVPMPIEPAELPMRPPVRDTTPDFEMQPPMPTPAPMLIEPPVRVVQPKTTSYVPAYSPGPPAKPGELGYLQPPMPVDPGFVTDIPMMQPPMPPSDNVGLIDNRIGPGFGKPMQPTPSPIDNLSSSIRDALLQLQPSAPGGVDYGQPAQPASGTGLSRLVPEPYTPPVFEPYTPPMAEPYTPPSMQFSVDMPRVDYARDMYSVNPNEVSMLKMGGLAVKSKKGKC